jgi:D-3-phosphoglycerate dehydrogenase
MKVLITDKINEVAAKFFDGVAQVDFLATMPEEELAEKIKEYDALMIRSQTKVTKKILESATNLKIIGRAGVGVDNVDVEAATEKGIIVVNSPEGNTTAAAEHTIAMMLAVARHIPDANVSTRQGKWERSKFTGNEVFQKTLGIIGLGKIGARVAKVALALGMKVLVYDPYTSKEYIESLGCKYAAHLDDFWGECDFITVHVPKTRETAYLINKNTINRMKKGVRLINCARGGIIDEKALKEAIEEGQVAAAAIDVFDGEPISAENPLLECKGDLILTPHLGASTEEAQLNVAIDVAEQIAEVLKGGSAKSAVNIPSLKQEKLEPVKNYMQIAENLGKFIRQYTKGSAQNLEITVNGTLSELDISPLKIAILKGFLSTSFEGVNYVNAPYVAKARGITITDIKSDKSCSYAGLLTLKLSTEQETNIISGALITDKMPRIVRINEYTTSIEPSANILIVPHENKPNMIAQVATILGSQTVNISMMQVSDNKKTGESIMIINIDQPIDDDTNNKIKKIDGIHDSRYISLTR